MLFKIGLLAFGLIIVIAVMSAFGLDTIVMHLLSANLNLILLAIFLQIATVAIMAVRLKKIASNCYIFPGLCHLCNYRSALKITLIGFAVNSLTPFAKIGGEPAKIYYLRKKGFPTESASAVIATDSLTELVTIYLIIVISVIIMSFSGILSAQTLSLLIGGAIFSLVIFAFVFYTLFNRNMLSKTINFFIKFARIIGLKKYVRPTKKDYALLFQNSMKNTFQNRSDVAKYFAISFVSKIVEFLRTWVIFLALGIVLPFHIIIFVWSIIMMLSLVPWLPGNLGLIEAGGTSAYILFGVTTGIAATGMIIERMMSLWLMLAIGLLLIWMSKADKIEKIIEKSL